MRRWKISQRSLSLIFIFVMTFSAPLAAQAQQGATVTGQGTLAEEVSFTLAFDPSGGPVTGSTKTYTQSVSMNLGVAGYSYSGSTTYPACNITGDFAGSDGGALQAKLTCVGQSKLLITTPVGNGNTTGTTNLTAVLSGNLSANGSGGGAAQVSYTTTIHAFTMNGINFPASTSPPQTTSSTWKLTYDGKAFQAALAPPTFEHFQQVYGLTLENGDAEWKPEELRWLDQLLKELPPDFRKNLALQKMVRYKESWNQNWQTSPNTFGDFSPVDQRECPGCAMWDRTIRVYDHASSPYDFKDPATQFKGTILHEMTHAFQSYKSKTEVQSNVSSTPLLQNFMDKTRPKPESVAGIYKNGWAYGYKNPITKEKEWRFYGAAGNNVPTDYSGTNPQEDLCESTMLYLYDPQRLKASSQSRYDFVRDNLFKGVEYENGTQKKR